MVVLFISYLILVVELGVRLVVVWVILVSLV